MPNLKYVGLFLIIIIFGILFIPKIVAASQNYSQELAKASTQLEQLNSSYQKQISDSQGNEDFNNKVNQNAEQLRAQMESLSANLAANLKTIESIFGIRSDFGIASFTIDPDHDTPSVLKKIL